MSQFLATILQSNFGNRHIIRGTDILHLCKTLFSLDTFNKAYNAKNLKYPLKQVSLFSKVELCITSFCFGDFKNLSFPAATRISYSYYNN